MQKHDYSQRKYKVLAYDARWPIEFENIRRTLHRIFGPVAQRIEHVGSTAVPGMSGKPTIDILVLVNDMSAVDRFDDQMREIGYRPLGAYIDPGGRLFALEKDNERLVNVHCFSLDHPKAGQLLLIRDYLRSHAEASAAYANLKLDLYEKYPMDYGSYRKEKDEYMSALEQRAKEWIGSISTSGEKRVH